MYFYPRSPCGERRCFRCCAISCITISIHALLAESDANSHGGRQGQHISIHALLAESDVSERVPLAESTAISIHALLAESDPQNWQKPHGQKKFLSTLSLRRATRQRLIEFRKLLFLSTLSLRRATYQQTAYFLLSDISIHALLAESDARRDSRQQPAGISIHALLAESDKRKSDQSLQR